MCNCIEITNKALVEKDLNTQLSIAFSLKPEVPHKVIIATEKIDQKNRKKPITLIPSFCPFCGKKYEEKDG